MTMGGNERRLGNTIHLLGRLGDIFYSLKILSSTYPVIQSHMLLQFSFLRITRYKRRRPSYARTLTPEYTYVNPYCCYCTRYALYYQRVKNHTTSSSGLYAQVYWAQPVFSNLACRNNLVGQCMNWAVPWWLDRFGPFNTLSHFTSPTSITPFALSHLQ